MFLRGGIMSEKDLLQRIEELRKKLNAFALGKSLIDPEVISLSQLLDCLLNQYHTISGV